MTRGSALAPIPVSLTNTLASHQHRECRYSRGAVRAALCAESLSPEPRRGYTVRRPLINR